jgi:hypothetical protein
MIDRKKETDLLSKEIISQLSKLESTFWEVHVYPGDYPGFTRDEYNIDYEMDDKETWLFYGTRMLYYKICLFLELKGVHLYYKMFIDKFHLIISDKNATLETRGPLYSESEPSMIIHDEFREFLSSFQEFNNDYFKKIEVNKLKLILESTNFLLSKTNTEVTNEASIYNLVRSFIEIVYPSARNLNKARFIKKFKTYHPDILVPELSSAVEYKFLRKGSNLEDYLDQIKIDAENYEGDNEYLYFYAIIYYENKNEITPAAFKQSVHEKKFPETWTILQL